MPAADLLTLVASLSTTVHATDVGPGVVRLDLLSVPDELRGRGCAKDALTQITRWADETDTTIVLTATYGLGANLPRLLVLYMSFQFVPLETTPLHEVRMRRDPLAMVPAVLLEGPLAELSEPCMTTEQVHA